MPTIRVNNSNFEYLEQGNGTPVVFVHGSISDYRTWKKQIDYFSKQYHVVAYSRRYHYPNNWEGNGADYTVSMHAKDLALFIKELGLGRVHLIGSSYGAYTALITAIHHPELIKSLVLGEPPVLPLLIKNPDNPLHILWLLIRNPLTAISFIKFGLRAMKPAQEALRKDKLEEAVKLFADGVMGKGKFDSLPVEVRTIMIDNSNALKAELLGPGFIVFPKEEAKQLKTPVLFVHGKCSPRFFRSITKKLSVILPNTENAFVSNASHGIHRDNPDAYNKVVSAFLAKHENY